MTAKAAAAPLRSRRRRRLLFPALSPRIVYSNIVNILAQHNAIYYSRPLVFVVPAFSSLRSRRRRRRALAPRLPHYHYVCFNYYYYVCFNYYYYVYFNYYYYVYFNYYYYYYCYCYYYYYYYYYHYPCGALALALALAPRLPHHTYS